MQNKEGTINVERKLLNTLLFAGDAGLIFDIE